jgi:hypothetical protein
MGQFHKLLCEEMIFSLLKGKIYGLRYEVIMDISALKKSSILMGMDISTLENPFILMGMLIYLLLRLLTPGKTTSLIRFNTSIIKKVNHIDIRQKSIINPLFCSCSLPYHTMYKC